MSLAFRQYPISRFRGDMRALVLQTRSFFFWTRVYLGSGFSFVALIKESQ